MCAPFSVSNCKKIYYENKNTHKQTNKIPKKQQMIHRPLSLRAWKKRHNSCLLFRDVRFGEKE